MEVVSTSVIFAVLGSYVLSFSLIQFFASKTVQNVVIHSVLIDLVPPTSDVNLVVSLHFLVCLDTY